MTTKVLLAFGTRPEAIKMAPVVAALRRRAGFAARVAVTAQHRDLLDQVLARFGLVPDVDLDLMRPGQTLASLTARGLEAMTGVLERERPDVVLVQGDTTTAMVTALAAFYLGLPVGHVEAGLRSGRLDAPFPEEMNRIVVDRLASRLYPPTERAARHLAAEGLGSVPAPVTGNTAIDALLDMRGRLPALDLPVRARVPDGQRLVLVTAHRREAFGPPIERVFGAVAALARAHPDVVFVAPVHPNPRVRGPAARSLRGPNLVAIDPVDYAEAVWLLDRCDLVLTDSGGIQEEAPALGRPVLVLREVTERPELVASGGGVLVGTDPERIVAEATRLLADEALRSRMGRTRLLFGDGRASERIAADLAGETVEPWRAEPVLAGAADPGP